MDTPVFEVEALEHHHGVNTLGLCPAEASAAAAPTQHSPHHAKGPTSLLHDYYRDATLKKIPSAPILGLRTLESS